MSQPNHTLRFFFFISVIAVLVCILFGKYFGAFVMAIFLLLFYWILSPAWKDNSYYSSRLAISSLFLISGVATFNNFSIILINHFLQTYTTIPKLDKISTQNLVIVILAIISLNLIYRRQSQEITRKTELDGVSNDQVNKELQKLKEIIKRDLNEINNTYNWEADYYEPLKAKVTLETAKNKTRKVYDLIRGIKKSKSSKVTLILGPPGSGKSVALRTITENLLEQFERDEQLPIYVNLKEWTRSESEKKGLPTPEQFEEFLIRHVLEERFTVTKASFLKNEIEGKTIFSKLLEKGRFFLILDSFDEIPELLDLSPGSQLYKEFSNIIFKFLSLNKGIVSSRSHRVPSFKADMTMHLRSFTENNIRKIFNKVYKKDVVKELLNSRQDLTSIARNPFNCSLLKFYASKHPDSLPKNRTDLYEYYLFEVLKENHEVMSREEEHNAINLKLCDVNNVVRLIADEINKNDELDVPRGDVVSTLEQTNEYTAEQIEYVLALLVKGKIARQGKSKTEKYSFVHKRFNEYFYANKLLVEINRCKSEDILEQLPLSDILNDGRHRDALVLFCEIAPENISTAIAEYCWDSIKKSVISTSKKRELVTYKKIFDYQFIHPLKFIVDAYQGQIQCIRNFQNELGCFVSDILVRDYDIHFKKNALEATCLLNEDKVGQIIENSLRLKNEWLGSTAINSCRNFNKISSSLKIQLMKHIASIDVFKFITQVNGLVLIFSLSTPFKSIEKYCWLRCVDGALLALGSLILLTIDSFLFVCSALIGILFVLFLSVMDALTSSNDNGNETKKKHKPHSKNTSAKPLRRALRRLLYYKGKSFQQIIKEVRLARINKHEERGFFSRVSIILGATRLFHIVGLVFAFENSAFISERIYQIYKIQYNDNFILLFLLLIPYFSIYTFVKTFSSKRFVFLALLVSLILTSLFLAKSLGTSIPKDWFPFISSILLLWLISVLIKWFIGCFERYKRTSMDKKFYAESIKSGSFTRERISKDFYGLNTQSYRDKYLTFLENKNITPDGNWPDGRLPNIDNDKSSTKLAQLEERWLGISDI
ncbi:NACHT domain-containing protein [Catenovulum sp. SM1970]|uniref:NACHT domain-containing protein n=1 Tax=Marinifaba aquimaris TaxID=2741323 RepID=UPI001573AE16|nr:NACHT domain-containing protein [Marinifaba aquimaris]NTS78141.1 NACHT domain-containing protein [Marinifaba aquimaris]